MSRLIVVGVLVLAVAVAIRLGAAVAHVDANPVHFVQSLGDENEPDENEGGDGSGDSGD
jgi:NAD/NADP transhydrogenase alpha subunit